MGVERGSVIELDFCTYIVLDVTDRTLMVEDMSGFRKSIDNTEHINIIQSKQIRRD